MKLVHVLISCLLLCLIRHNGSKRRKFKRKKQDNEVTANRNKLAAVCLKGLMESENPEFCWKQGGDVGTIPEGCRQGYFRSLLLCFENCQNGYRHILGICYKNCKPGYSDHGLTCYKSLLDFYGKSSYVPNSHTLFDQNVSACPRGKYLSGALCYKDCKVRKMVNCGTLSCASSREACTGVIVTMATDVFKGVVDLLIFVSSFGGSSTANAGKASSSWTRSLKNKLLSVSSDQWRSRLNRLIFKWRDASYRRLLMNRVKTKVSHYLRNDFRDIITGHWSEYTVEKFCSQIFNDNITQREFNLDLAIGAFDVFNVKESVDNCSNFEEEGSAENCARNILQGISAADPTGLLTIISTFIHPVCELNLDEEIIDDEQQVRIPHVEPRNIHFYPECDFQGTGEIVWPNKVITSPSNLTYQLNPKSMLSGNNAQGYIYPGSGKRGFPRQFSKGYFLSCTETSDDCKDCLQDIDYRVGSVIFINSPESCINIYYNRPNHEYGFNVSVCGTKHVNSLGANSVELPNDAYKLQIYSFNNAITTVTVYSETYERGESWVLELGFIQKPVIYNIRSAYFP